MRRLERRAVGLLVGAHPAHDVLELMKAARLQEARGDRRPAGENEADPSGEKRAAETDVEAAGKMSRSEERSWACEGRSFSFQRRFGDVGCGSREREENPSHATLADSFPMRAAATRRS